MQAEESPFFFIPSFEFKVRQEIGRCMGKQQPLAEHILEKTRNLGSVAAAVKQATDELKAAMPWTDWVVLGFTGT